MEAIRVRVTPSADGEVYDITPEDAAAAGWSDDPGTGKAILVPDERGAPGYEVLNPLPIAPPIGWTPEPPIDELIRQRVREEYERWKEGEEEIDIVSELDDFDVEDEVIPAQTMYEFYGMEPQVPALKPRDPKEEAAAQVEYEGHLEEARRIAKKRSRAEYERRKKEMEELYGQEAVKAVLPIDEEEKGA